MNKLTAGGKYVIHNSLFEDINEYWPAIDTCINNRVINWHNNLFYEKKRVTYCFALNSHIIRYTNF